MAPFSVFCELKEEHVLVYRSDGTTRVNQVLLANSRDLHVLQNPDKI